MAFEELCVKLAPLCQLDQSLEFVEQRHGFQLRFGDGGGLYIVRGEHVVVHVKEVLIVVHDAEMLKILYIVLLPSYL